MPTGIIFLLVLSVLVLVHEAGHFLAARLLGIKVEEFAFGLPFTKPIFKIKRKETQYAIYPLLFGGFVRLHGEEAEGAEKARSFWNRTKKQRLLVIGAGIIMNLVLALAAFIVLYSISGVPVSKTDKVTILAVTAGSPAQEAGIQPDDRIIGVEGRRVETVNEFSTLMKSWAGVGVNLAVQRGPRIVLFEGLAEKTPQELNIYVVPRANPPAGQGALGVAIADLPYLETRSISELPVWKFAGLSVKQGVISTGEWIGKVLDGLRMIGKSLSRGQAPEGVSGPVGIYQLTGIVAAEGFLPLLELVAILSVNLAVFNFLPIPALDGGRLLFIYIEAITRKRISPVLEQKINSWGMIFLLSLMALISLQDVIRLDLVGKLLGK